MEKILWTFLLVQQECPKNGSKKSIRILCFNTGSVLCTGVLMAISCDLLTSYFYPEKFHPTYTEAAYCIALPYNTTISMTCVGQIDNLTMQ